MTQTSTISTIEKLFIKTGKILAVRCWDGDGLHEVDIHLPDVDFAKWDKAQSIKCRISPLHFTDYTPAMWDAEEKTCTLYIDTSHHGQGSQWAKKQQEDNPFHYLKIETEKHFPVAGKHLVFLGDQTAIGHFCALQQLAPAGTKIDGCIAFNDLQTAAAFAENCPWLPLQAVSNYGTIFHQTQEWIIQIQSEKDNCVFYVAGNLELIVTLKKLLKSYNINGSQIKSKGFWQ